MRRPRIMTHLFADGGRIIRSNRCEYGDRLGEDGLPDIVRAMMREQHKAMFIALRSGKHDTAITEICGAFPATDAAGSTPRPDQVASRPTGPAPLRRNPTPAIPRPLSDRPPAQGVPATIPPPPRRPTMPGLRAVASPAGTPGGGDPSQDDAQHPPSGPRYVETRPAPGLTDAPAEGVSIFGGGGDATLDAAILEYLAGDDAKRG